jgi:hydrogenase small subunit
MESKDTLWGLFQKKQISRRSFVKSCVTIAGVMGLAPSMIPEIIKAAETKILPPVIWLHAHECTGCDETIIRSQTPLASDLVLNMISLEYMDVLGAAAGANIEHHMENIIQQYKGKYIVVIEGAIPLAEDGIHCMVGGKPILETFKHVAKDAAAIIEAGSCATWGGIQAARPNPTDSVAATDAVSAGGVPVVKVPGCPPIPEVLTGTIMHYVLFGELPPLDGEGRPKQFFGNRIHDTCYRRPFFDSGMYAEKFDDAGAKAGWCLYKVGCRGPVAYNTCGNMRWWNGLSYPIQSGAPCAGCSQPDFWDTDMYTGSFYDRLPGIPVTDTIANADKVGLALAGITTVGVVAHGVGSYVYHKKHEEKHEEGSEE